MREDRDLPCRRRPGASPRGPSAALPGGPHSGLHQVGAVTAGVGDGVQRGQQRVGSGAQAVGQDDEAAAPRDQALTGERSAFDEARAFGDVHEAHV